MSSSGPSPHAHSRLSKVPASSRLDTAFPSVTVTTPVRSWEVLSGFLLKSLPLPHLLVPQLLCPALLCRGSRQAGERVQDA